MRPCWSGGHYLHHGEVGSGYQRLDDGGVGGIQHFRMRWKFLVAFIQAYVFTMLSAVFIGLSQEVKEHAEKNAKKEN